AIHCQLVDIKPFGEQKTWSDQTRETTCNLLLNKSFVAQRKDQEPLSDGKTEEQDTFSEGVSDTTRSVDDGPEVEIEEDNDEKPPPEIEEQKPEANNEKPTNTDVPEATKPENKQQTSGIDVAKSRKSEVPQPEVSIPEVSQTESKTQTPGYPPPVIPQARQFQAGVTYVGMDGSIYAQEMKDGMLMVKDF
ncbi:predicted protein, partial [Nematostella vectensis]